MTERTYGVTKDQQFAVSLQLSCDNILLLYVTNFEGVSWNTRLPLQVLHEHLACTVGLVPKHPEDLYQWIVTAVAREEAYIEEEKLIVVHTEEDVSIRLQVPHCNSFLGQVDASQSIAMGFYGVQKAQVQRLQQYKQLIDTQMDEICSLKSQLSKLQLLNEQVTRECNLAGVKPQSHTEDSKPSSNTNRKRPTRAKRKKCSPLKIGPEPE